MSAPAEAPPGFRRIPGLTVRFERIPPKLKRPPGRKPTPPLYDWTAAEMRRAHQAYNAGHRDLWAREGERIYSRNRRRVQRARLSAADLAWAERDAVRASWRASDFYRPSTNQESEAA